MNEPAQNPSGNPWEIVFQQAIQFHGRGQLAEAGSLFAAIVEHNPGHVPSLHRLAAIRRHQDRYEESLALLQRAIDCNPGFADTYNSLGNTLNSLGRQEEAIEQYRRALELRADFPEAQVNLGNSLKALRRYDEAAARYRDAIALRAGYADAHSNLGIALAHLNRPAEAVASFSTAISFDPRDKVAYNNLGMALIALNRHEEALPYFRSARKLEPDSPQSALNEAIVHLALGDFERAWPGYEARRRLPELKVKPRDFAQPAWDGRADIAGKTILLHAEQGLGDMILFARFVQPVAERGARVVLEVQPPLVRLMSGMPGAAEVLAYGDALPDFDFHLPFGSLPGVFRTTVNTIPARTPYLRAPVESETIAGLEERRDSRPTVGICWAGNPAFPNDANRSVPLSLFEQVFHVPGVRFVSLQQNLRPGDDAILSGFDHIDLTSDRKGTGLADTAALVSKLDLVITVDTVIGHLAGALGRPAWILLPHSAYWPWLRERTDSPWYPSARLFRQPEFGEWKSVLAQVGEALRESPPSSW